MSRRSRHGRPAVSPRPGHAALGPAGGRAAPGDARAETRADTHPEPRKDPRSDPRPQDTRGDARFDTRVESRPDTRAEARQMLPGGSTTPPFAAPAPRPSTVAPAPFAHSPAPADMSADRGPERSSCTVAQLRRFIKSRPWVPMHELRRRFGIMGFDDDVTPMRVADHTLFVGLPTAEGRMLAELLGVGDVGYELSVDPLTPVVIGVYPMRPVPRA